MFPEFRDYEVGPLISEPTLAGSSGAPIEASRKGKAPPLERGRCKTFPFLSSPIGNYRKPLGEEMMGPTYNIRIQI
jgi:hypothetical protein